MEMRVEREIFLSSVGRESVMSSTSESELSSTPESGLS